MKISDRYVLTPKLSLGLKRYLFYLNQSLDKIKNDITLNKEMKYTRNHSIMGDSNEFTNIEKCIFFLEDRNYFHHNGFELRSIPRFFKRFLRSGSIGGVSTIDQQIVRISLQRSEKTFSRKLNEIILALCINFHCSKRDMFDYYIHNAYLGYRIEGCEVAARQIFGLSAAALNRDQAAFIASLLPLPIPKSVLLKYKSHQNYPFIESKDIIEFAQEIDPRWSKRISVRVLHANKSYNFKPKSL